MYTTILVPLDGSPVAERALLCAQTLAKASGARLLLVRAALLEPSSDETALSRQARAMTEARNYLDQVVRRLDLTIAIEIAVLYGEAAEAILTTIRARKVNLIVLSSHGHSGLGRWVIGTVTDRLLRRADIPVLVVPATFGTDWPDSRAFRVLVPLDGSALAEEALGPAVDLARALDAELLLLRVIDPVQALSVGPSRYLSMALEPSNSLQETQHYLECAAARLRRGGVAVSVHSAIGTPGLIIASAAREQHAQLIAMTPHGAAGPSRLMLGRAATTILQHAGCPVLLVRPSATREAQPWVGPAAEETGFEALPVNVVLTPHELRLIVRGLENMVVAQAHVGQGTREIQELLTRLQWATTPVEPEAVPSP
jgi:nucleotide-binding universal stress UspA family protein